MDAIGNAIMGVINEIRTFIELSKQLFPELLVDRYEQENEFMEKYAQSLRIMEKINWDEVELREE